MASSKPAAVVLLFVIAVAALALRFCQLDRRPMHHDEANQAVRTGVLQETGAYRYDPHDHHGPTLYYLTLPFAWLTSGRDFAGTTETTFRVVPVLFGAGLILLLAWMVDGLGWVGVLVSAALTALSPAMVYYSRFYIQEMLLVFFTFGTVVGLWRWTRTGTWAWALVTGVFIGLMFTTKETCIIAWVSMVIALEIAEVWSGTRRGVLMSMRIRPGQVAAAAGTVAVVAVVFYSSFFTHGSGVVDAVRAYRVYFERGVDSQNHGHPWYYYWQVLGWFQEGGKPVWSEGLILALAAIGAGAIVLRRKCGGADIVLLRFLLVYTVLMTVFYSAIPHKTPWLALSFLHGMILLAGAGVIALLEISTSRVAHWAVGTCVVAAVAQLATQTYRANFRYESDPRNPYAYVHTSRDVLKLVKRIENVAARDEVVAVITNEYDAWPLPWYLRKYRRVGYWHNVSEIPSQMKPAVIVTSMDKEQAFTGYETEFYGLRPNVLLNLHIREDLWQKFLSSSSRQ